MKVRRDRSPPPTMAISLKRVDFPAGAGLSDKGLFFGNPQRRGGRDCLTRTRSLIILVSNSFFWVSNLQETDWNSLYLKFCVGEWRVRKNSIGLWHENGSSHHHATYQSQSLHLGRWDWSSLTTSSVTVKRQWTRDNRFNRVSRESWWTGSGPYNSTLSFKFK